MKPMRRVMAAFLLACLGVIIPLAGSPVRVCVLDGKLLMPGFSECSREAAQKAPCCPDCGEKDHGEQPCCLGIKELPDATTPDDPGRIPAAVVMDLPENLFSIPDPVAVRGEIFHAAVPIRGPDGPVARRALLGVWRL